MNKQEREFIARYEKEVRNSGIYDRFGYYAFAQRLIAEYPMVAYAALADKLQELARERREQNR